jgi:hypothetical protein
VTNETTTKTPAEKREAANARRRAARAAKKGGAAAKVVTKAKGKDKPAAEKVAKKTDPGLFAKVRQHAEKNKDKNGWDKVHRMSAEKLTELLAGAKTENAAIKRARAVASA